MKTKFVPSLKGLDQVTTELGPGEIVGFTANTFAAFDAGGDLESLPGWAVNTDTGGASALLNLAPSADVGSPSTWVINNFQNSVNPSVPLVNLSFQNMQNFWTIAGVEDTNSHIGFNNGIQHASSGNILDVQAINNNLTLGNGTDTNTSRNSSLLNQYGRVELNHTADNVVHISTFLQLDGTVTGGVTGVQLANNVAGSINGYVGFNNNTVIEATGDITSYSNGFIEGLTLRTGSTIQGHSGININPIFETGTTVALGYQAINIGGNMNGTITNNWTGVGVFPNFTGAVDAIQAVSANMNINTGTAVTNGLDGFNTSIGMQAGTSAAYAHLFSGNTQIAATATLPVLECVSVNATIDSTTMTDAKLINAYFSGTGSVTNIQGLNVDVTNLASPNRKLVIGGNGGALQINSPMDTSVTTLNLAESGNNLGGQFTVAAGSPLAGGEFIFGNNLAYTAVIQDDMGPDVTGIIGFTNVGFVGQIIVAAGKTIDTYNLAGGGAGVPVFAGDGGTVTHCTMYHAIGLLPSGGNIAVTNMYGFRVSPILTAVAPTNAWGISVEDANADNYFAKNVVIGGGTKLPTFAAALDVTGDATFSGVIKDDANTDSIDTNNRLLKDSAGTSRLTWDTSTLVSDAVAIQLNAVGGTQQGVKFFDDSNTNSTTLRAAGTTTTSVVYDLPPDDGAAGDVLKTNGSGVLSWGPSPFLPVYLEVDQLISQSIPLATMTTLIMDNIRIDNLSAFNNITGEYTVPTGYAGRYRIFAAVAFSGFIGYFYPMITVNAVNYRWARTYNDVSYGNSAVTTSIVDLADGDVVAAAVIQQSAGSQSTQANQGIYLSLERIG